MGGEGRNEIRSGPWKRGEGYEGGGVGAPQALSNVISNTMGLNKRF